MVQLPPNFNFPGAQSGIPQGVFQLIQSMQGMGGMSGGLGQSIGQLMNPGMIPGGAPLPTLPNMPVLPNSPAVDPRGPKPPIVPDPTAIVPGKFKIGNNGGFLEGVKSGETIPGGTGGRRLRISMAPELFNKMSATDQQQAITAAHNSAQSHRNNAR